MYTIRAMGLLAALATILLAALATIIVHIPARTRLTLCIPTHFTIMATIGLIPRTCTRPTITTTTGTTHNNHMSRHTTYN